VEVAVVAEKPQGAAGSLGLDIGGTRVKAARVASDGTTSEVVTRPIGARSGPALIDLLADVVGGLLAIRPEAAAVGLALPGVVDRAFGSRSLPGKLDYLDGFPLVETMTARFGLPTVCENDAVSATLGEWVFGAGRGLTDLTMLTLGTGIGCGVVTDGAMHRLLNRGIGLPHAPSVGPGAECGVCGNTGCPETRLSGPAVSRRARELVASSPGGLLRHLPLDDEHGFASVCLAARRDDPLALGIVSDFADDLSSLAVAAAHVYGTSTVVLSGGLMLGSDLFLGEVRQRARARAWHAAHEPPLTVLIAAEPQMCGVQGIGYLASQLTEVSGSRNERSPIERLPGERLPAERGPLP
jgi:glucokinase